MVVQQLGGIPSRPNTSNGSCQFQPFIPGLLQTLDFAHQRQLSEAEIGPVTFSSERAVEARQTRQRMLRRPDGPSYEVVLDEISVRRLPAPPEASPPSWNT